MTGTSEAIRTTTYVVAKSKVIGGRPYAPGDPFDISQLDDHKVSQLLAQRIIRPVMSQPDT
jgi:hypothetical protein